MSSQVSLTYQLKVSLDYNKLAEYFDFSFSPEDIVTIEATDQIGEIKITTLSNKLEVYVFDLSEELQDGLKNFLTLTKLEME
jgi:hypothetical protein